MDISGVGPPILSQPVVTIRTIGPGRPPLARWKVYDAAGAVVGVVAEERAERDGMATFTVIHNPTGVPFRPPAGRRLSALGAWSSSGHRTVPAAVATLVEHLTTMPVARRFVTFPKAPLDRSPRDRDRVGELADGTSR